MRKCKVTLADGMEEYEAYTDGTLWNGWADVCFSTNQVIDFLKTTPYDFRFEVGNGNDYGLVIYWGGLEEFYPCTPLPLDNGDIIEGYFLDGLEWVEVE